MEYGYNCATSSGWEWDGENGVPPISHTGMHRAPHHPSHDHRSPPGASLLLQQQLGAHLGRLRGGRDPPPKLLRRSQRNPARLARPGGRGKGGGGAWSGGCPARGGGGRARREGWGPPSLCEPAARSERVLLPEDRGGLGAGPASRSPRGPRVSTRSRGGGGGGASPTAVSTLSILGG